jgi:D-alanyl-D-alanine endopeptidase (penicillin-binding protein 7)
MTRFCVGLAALVAASLVCLPPAFADQPVRSRVKKQSTLQAEQGPSARAVLVVDRETGKVLYEKNSNQVLPIASITKLMAAMTVLDSGVDLNESVLLNREDDLASRGRRRSRLPASDTLTRDELLRLMLMSSENKAAYALARSHPEGFDEFIRIMNDKAQLLGMFDTRFVEPTGLSDQNVSTAWDLKRLLLEANRYPLIRDYSTSVAHELQIGRSQLRYVNSNRLVRAGGWDIELQKTGTTAKAGKCVIMLATMAGRPVAVVLLNAHGKLGRVRDAKWLRAWVESNMLASGPASSFR